MYKIRDLNETIPLNNIYIGIVSDNVQGNTVLSVGIERFEVLEKIGYNIASSPQKRYIIYKDIELEKYSYVNADGRVCIPKDKKPFRPSGDLVSVSDMRSFREVLEAVVSKKPDYIEAGDEYAVNFLSFFETYLKSIEAIEAKGGRPIMEVGAILKQIDLYIYLYMLAFGNPLDRNAVIEIRNGRDYECAGQDVSTLVKRYNVIDASDKFGRKK